MAANWFDSIVLAMWFPEGVDINVLTELRKDFSGKGVFSAEYLPPNWFVVILDDSAPSYLLIDSFTTKVSILETLKGVRIGKRQGPVLMDLNVDGVSAVRPTGTPVHEAMLDAKR